MQPQTRITGHTWCLCLPSSKGSEIRKIKKIFQKVLDIKKNVLPLQPLSLQKKAWVEIENDKAKALWYKEFFGDIWAAKKFYSLF